MGLRHAAIEPIAALARVALALADPAAALDHVQAILDRHAAGPGWGGAYAARLTCWRVLTACADARADAVLAEAQADLRAAAVKIQDPDLRSSVLAGVAVNREIMAAAAPG